METIKSTKYIVITVKENLNNLYNSDSMYVRRQAGVIRGVNLKIFEILENY